MGAIVSFSVLVDIDKCEGCGRCERVCEYMTMEFDKCLIRSYPSIHNSDCTGCGDCEKACPFGAIQVTKHSVDIFEPWPCM